MKKLIFFVATVIIIFIFFFSISRKMETDKLSSKQTFIVFLKNVDMIKIQKGGPNTEIIVTDEKQIKEFLRVFENNQVEKEPASEIKGYEYLVRLYSDNTVSIMNVSRNYITFGNDSYTNVQDIYAGIEQIYASLPNNK